MFTGIVETIGTVSATTETDGGRRLVIDPVAGFALEIGASIAVNGVCLTAVAHDEDGIAVDVVPETLRRSNIGELVQGSDVNLERPMSADGRFDGHIVQGHVDGVGEVTGIEDIDGGVEMTIRPDQRLLRYLVEKGSVTVDGVSLTVASVEGDTLTVALIPHTLEVTTLGLRNRGDIVNLEMDVLAKYVERLMDPS